MANKKLTQYIGIGRRKRAIASVYLRPGKGAWIVNGRKAEDYFVLPLQRDAALAPIARVSKLDAYDVIVRVKGGGIEAQVTATQLGIARALVKENEERRQDLKGEGFLTRDPRKRERKKYGLAGARKRFQFSKR